MFQCQGKEAHVSIFKSRFCTVIDVFWGVFFHLQFGLKIIYACAH